MMDGTNRVETYPVAFFNCWELERIQGFANP
jgi:hypothetical protein